MVELIWDGKYTADGKRTAPLGKLPGVKEMVKGRHAPRAGEE